jgi:hypothetical protein
MYGSLAPQDIGAGIRCITAAADQGERYGRHRIAMHKSCALLRRSAQEGFPDAQHEHGLDRPHVGDSAAAYDVFRGRAGGPHALRGDRRRHGPMLTSLRTLTLSSIDGPRLMYWC